MIAAGRIAELLHEVGQHLLQHPWVHSGGRVIIHVHRNLDSGRASTRLGSIVFGRCASIRAHDCSPQTTIWNYCRMEAVHARKLTPVQILLDQRLRVSQRS